MGHTDSTKKSNFSPLLVLALISLVSVTNAAELEGGVSVGVSYTDNVLLGTAPDDQDDVIFQASPFLSIMHASSKFDANLNYAFDWFRYDKISSTSKYHRGDATILGKLWQDTLLTELGVSRSQQLGDPDDVIPAGRLFKSGNLIDQNEWWFNPKLVRDLGKTIALQANYRYSRTQIDDSRYQDRENNFGELGLDNYGAGSGVTWALRYKWIRAEFEVSAPWEFQQAGAELGFWVDPKTRVFGTLGRESSWDDPFDPSMEDSFWEAGVAHTAGENLVVEFAAGERSFGSSWRSKLDYKFKRGTTSLSYTESPETPGFSESGQTQNALNPADLDDFLSRPDSADRYISSRLEWSAELDLRRTKLGLRVFDEDRSDRVGSTGVVLDDQSQTGASVKVSWKLGARTEFVVSGSRVNRDLDITNRSRFSSAGFEVNYRLGDRSEASLEYTYHDEQPRGGSQSVGDYVANVVSLLFTFTP